MRKWLLMTKIRFVRYLFALCLGASIGFQAQSNYSAAELDVVYYDVTIEPDIAAKTIKGTVKVAFVSQADEVEFNREVRRYKRLHQRDGTGGGQKFEAILCEVGLSSKRLNHDEIHRAAAEGKRRRK